MKLVILGYLTFLLNSSFSQIENSKIIYEDFLNKYILSQIPINNSTFTLNLSKVIINNVRVGKDYNRTYENTVTSIPEIINANNLVYWTLNEGAKIKYSSDFNFSGNDVNCINKMLPKIEIIKNKFLTLKYPDGKEESFLYSYETDSSDFNIRTSLEIKLKSDFEDNEANNRDNSLIMRIYPIDGDCYLAISYSQLERLSIKIKDDVEEIEMKYLDLYGESHISNYNSDGGDEFGYTSGNNMFLSRKSNDFYSEKISDNLYIYYSEEFKKQIINPESIIYLFKLVEN
jgi:hypothetical protein